MKPNILVLASEQPDFNHHDDSYPFYLTEIDGVSILEKIIANTSKISNLSYSLALLDKDIELYHIDKIVCFLAPGAAIIRIPKNTLGSACTSLFAASQLDQDAGLLIVSANELVDINLSDVITNFRQRNLNGGVLTFRSVHTRYTYVRLNSSNLVSEAAQQNSISHHATTGVFWFARTLDFVESAKNLIRKNINIGGKFHIFSTINELILQQARIGAYEIDLQKYKPQKYKVGALV